MKKTHIKKIFNCWLLLPFMALATIIISRIAIAIPEKIESVYSRAIYPAIASILSRISGIFPFSLDDVIYILLIVSVPGLVLLILLRKVSLKNAGKITLNVLSLVIILFYWLWGFNYFRSDINTRLNISESEVSNEAFEKVLEEIITDVNHTYSSFENYDINEADHLVEESYKELSQFLKLNYPMGKRKAKKITFSRFFASAAISGYYGPFFNEIHLNKFLLPVQYPMILAHEKAHQFGVTSEAEANFYAWLVCSQSNNLQLQYSANLYILKYFLFQGSKLENYSELVSKIDDNVRNDFRKISKHWMELRNEKIDHAAGKVN
ncbi:MAG: DUF3810 domain-containing protein, partial [Mariniphaga sp.]|nr:DUF3810 domain-containing protein [Mariniphaga sp.]